MSDRPIFSQSTSTTIEEFNILAIVGFILAFIFNIAGAIISFIALAQIRRTGQRGRGFALAGAIIGTISFILSVIGIIAIVVISTSHMS